MKGSGNVAKLAIVEAGRDQARTSLAEAISYRDELAATVAALNAALPGARDRLSAARTAAASLSGALKEAKDANALHLVNAWSGSTAGEAPPSVASVRQRITNAEDDLEIARDAETTLRGRLAEQSSSLTTAQGNVAREALAVLRQSPGIAALIAEVHALQCALAEKGRALEWLSGKNLLPTEGVSSGVVQYPQPLGQALTQLGVKPQFWEQWHSAAAPSAAAWETALAELMKDPDAPLPV
jgi:hypothetical protein